MSERWHFQIDGKRYGPVETADLDRFLAPPRLCRFMEVRRDGGGDDWISIGPQDDLSTACKRLGVVLPPRVEPTEPESADAPRPAKTAKASKTAPVVINPAPVEPWRPGLLARLLAWAAECVDEFAAFVARFWMPFAFIGLLLALNLGLYIFSRFDYPSDNEVLGAYVEVWNEYLQLREAKTTAEQWQAFAQSSTERLSPLVEGLATRTDAETPLRRHLLWAGRDCLLPLASSGAGERPSRVEFNFQQHLNAIDQLRRGESPRPMFGAPRM